MSHDFDFCLPPGWAVARIADLIGPQGLFTDGDWIESKDQDPNGDVRLIQLADIGDGTFRNRSSRFLTSQKAEELSCTFLHRGDILVARMPDPLGRACIFPGTPGKSVTAVDVCIIRTGIGDLDNRWIMWAINSPEFRRRILELQSGTTRQRISRRNLATLPIPVPPAAEQCRIADEIEKQISRLDAAVTALKRADANLKIHRTSILKTACEGRLVPTEAELARAEGRGYEPASELLRRILEERTRGLRSSSLLSVNLPEGWTTARVHELADVGTGATPLRSDLKYYQGGTIPWVTSGALNKPFVSEPTELITQAAMDSCNLTVYPKGTILLAMYGEGKTRGKNSELQIEASTNQAIAAIVTEGLAQKCQPYLKFFLQKNYEDIRRMSSGGVQPNLNLSIVKNLAIPLPPLAEQERIVEELERRLSFLDQVKGAIQVNLERANHLRQSILRRAFEGRLVPQDSNDEPPSNLLERIRETTFQTAPKGRRGAPPIQVTRRLPKPTSKRLEATIPAPPPTAIEPDPGKPLFIEHDPSEQLELAWEILFGRGLFEKEDAVRAIAEGLRDQGLAHFQHLRKDGPLFNDIASAIDRGVRQGFFDRPKRGHVRAILPDPKAYSPDDWRLCLLGALDGAPIEEEDALRAAAEWARETMGLEFARLREDGVILKGLRAALKEAVGRGEVERVGRRQIRRTG